MKTVTTKAMAKVAAVATGLAMATSMLSLAPMAHAAALTSAQVQSILGLLSSFGANAATIANVNAALTGTTSTSSGSTTTTTSACSFSRSLTIGSTGADVTCLQSALIGGGFSIPAGATGYFGTQTRTAVASWQSSKNIAPAVGYFGSISRAAFNLGGSSSSTTTTTTTTTQTAGTGNGLKVALAATSPNGSVLVKSQATGDLAEFTFANPTSSDVKVTNLTFKRIGVSADSDILNAYLFDGAVRITDPAGISNSSINFNDSTGIFTVPAGGVKTISVRADLGSGSGEQIGVQLVAVSGATLDSSVSLPISGGYQTVSSATIATVVFSAVTIPNGTTVSPGNDVTVFQTTATVAPRAVNLRSLTLENRGSTVDGDFQNLKLFVRGVQVGSTVASTVNKKVTFDFSANPLRLETGANQIRVTADVVGGSGDTADFQIRRAIDAQLIDSNLGQALIPTATVAFSGTAADSIEGVALSVTKASNSPSAALALDATGVKMASFEFRATGDNLKIEQITASSTSTGNAGLDNGKIFLNGIQVGSTQDLVSTGTAFSLGSSMILTRGTTAIVDVYADAKKADSTPFTTGATAYVGVSVATADTEGVKSGNRLTTAISNVIGNTLTISSATLSASTVGSYSNQSVVKGTQNFKIGSFTLLASANEGVDINTIAIAFASAETSTLTNLRLENSSTHVAIGTTKYSIAGAGADNTFSVNNISLAASASIGIDVFADVSPTANIGAISAATVTTSTGGIGKTANGSIVLTSAPTLQTVTVVGSGTLATAVGDSPTNAIVVGGMTAVKVGSFNFLATNSNMTVNKVIVKVPTSSASAVSQITLKNGTTGAPLKTQVFTMNATGSLPYSTSAFEGLGFLIPAGESRALDVYVDVASISAGNASLSGQGISVILDGNEGFEATDGSNLTTTLTGSLDMSSVVGTTQGVAYVRKSVPTLSTDGTTSNSFALINANSLPNAVIGRFTVTADTRGGVDWGKIVFNVTKSAAVTLDATTTIKVYEVTGGIHALVGGSFATSTESTVSGLQMFTTAATSGIIDFRPTTVQKVTFGSSKTYQVETTLGGVTTGLSVSLSIAGPSTGINTAAILATVSNATPGTALSASVPSFVWSDLSDANHFATPTTATDWINDYLVKTLPLTIGTRAMP